MYGSLDIYSGPLNVISHIQVSSINWKDPENALTKQYPRVFDPEDPNVIEDLGSFFNIFEQKDADAEVRMTSFFGLAIVCLRLFCCSSRTRSHSTGSLMLLNTFSTEERM